MQPAQPTTVGKRACLWTYDLVLDLRQVERFLGDLTARGAKGTTGTQASFLQLFNGDHEKVKRLDQLVARRMGFDRTMPVTGQTYTRKIDSQLLDVLSGIAQSAHKMATDWRLLAHRKELEEPFESQQIGSSAMAYKRNPMRSERACALARFVFSLQTSTVQTAANQWMERTLDDSANRRLVIPQALMAVDAILILVKNIASGFVVYPHVIARNLAEELPFMATENILMAAVADGGDRQELHETIRVHSQASAAEVKQFGRANDLIKRLQADPRFGKVDFERVLNSQSFVGRAPQQVDEFIAEWVEPIRQRYRARKVAAGEVSV
jgi:adenylosuccinate lyase